MQLIAPPNTIGAFAAAEAVAFTTTGLGGIGAAFGIVTLRARRRGPSGYRRAAPTSASG